MLNKIDLLASEDQKHSIEHIKDELKEIGECPIIAISAVSGENLDALKYTVKDILNI